MLGTEFTTLVEDVELQFTLLIIFMVLPVLLNWGWTTLIGGGGEGIRTAGLLLFVVIVFVMVFILLNVGSVATKSACRFTFNQFSSFFFNNIRTLKKHKYVK